MLNAFRREYDLKCSYRVYQDSRSRAPDSSDTNLQVINGVPKSEANGRLRKTSPSGGSELVASDSRCDFHKFSHSVICKFKCGLSESETSTHGIRVHEQRFSTIKVHSLAWVSILGS